MNNDLKNIKGVGVQREKQFHRLGIKNISQLLEYFPRTYEDRSKIVKIAQVGPGDVAALEVEIVRSMEKRPRPRLSIVELLVSDDSGSLHITLFNQSYKKNFYKNGTRLLVYGKVEYAYGKMQMNSPYIEILPKGVKPEAKIVPVYPLSEGINQSMVRKTMETALALLDANEDMRLDILQETLPLTVKIDQKLMDKWEATKNYHFPASVEKYKEAYRTLAFEELFLMQIGLLLLRDRSTVKNRKYKMKKDGDYIKLFREKLPFKLTNDQEQTYLDICHDLEEENVPMQRLVQGDVGSGKTVVAAMTLLKAVENKYQGAIMAPTEILATQHYESLLEFYKDIPIKIALLTGSTKAKERQAIDEGLRDNSIDILIGTHALIQDNVVFNNLGLVVVDEQHRFGVKQRSLLQEKGEDVNVLIMTATPIPRTMALTAYGDLEVSSIKEMPPGRKPVKTYKVDSSYIERLYKFFDKEMNAGHQVYVVCPLVEESEKMDLKAAEELYLELADYYNGKHKVGLLHGRMKPKEKDEIMKVFQSGEYKMLVATTVIEVGVNVPNATIMYVVGAERFGLSQLHQLRGRVGRGDDQAYCILMSDTKSEKSHARLDLMVQTTDGFKLAEEDLLLRGAGQLFGNAQHGLPDLKVADIIRDLPLLIEARKAAALYIAVHGSDEVAKEYEKYLNERFGAEFINILYG